AKIVPTIAPTASQICVYSFACGRLRLLAATASPAATSRSCSARYDVSDILSAHEGAHCVEPQVPSSATAERQAPSNMRRRVGCQASLPPANCWRLKKRITGKV